MMKSTLFVLGMLLLLGTANARPLFAAELVNINTADKALLTTLNGIGDVKAQAIIDYRNAHGAFAKIEDIMNVSGIGAATFENIKDFITVTSAPAPTPAIQNQNASSTLPVASSAAAPLLPDITALIGTEDIATVAAGSKFVGSALGAKGEPLGLGVRYLWNFGDGATAEGQTAYHTFAYPGTYVVTLSVGYNYSSAQTRAVVSAVSAAVGLVAEGDGSLVVSNASTKDLNIGGWSLRQGTATFVIPEDTFVLARGGVRFAPGVLGFYGGASSVLLYSNGATAAPAKVGAQSPLRGVAVRAGEMPERPAVKQSAPVAPTKQNNADAARASSAVSTGEVQGAADERQKSGGSTALWYSLAGLAAVVGAGVAGAQYSRVRGLQTQETSVTADEFEIEE